MTTAPTVRPPPPRTHRPPQAKSCSRGFAGLILVYLHLPDCREQSTNPLVQSGLLIMPQAMAAMSTKFPMPRILDRVGYRNVLISNTVILGLLLMLFATVGPGTPLWVIVVQAFCYGAFTSLQYTSMNTLVYADIDEHHTSNASSIASTIQQMSISFGVAAAGLTTAFFIPDRFRSNPVEMIHGLHEAFVVLGGFTILSTIVFLRLKREDGGNVSHHKDLHLG